MQTQKRDIYLYSNAFLLPNQKKYVFEPFLSNLKYMFLHGSRQLFVQIYILIILN
uniref:Uncharacterized protein n=1 Tax=Lotus japonicus TaxID=34305 RepID=I3S0J4_LOTJA|nr:unknown [Lotus japonicus]